MDVSSLYTSIPHNAGLQAIRNKLPNDDHTKALIKLTEFILKHNYFEFNEQIYLQISGTAMGTRMAPQYANLFMADLEENFLLQHPLAPFMYLRYIDDIFMIWPHGERKLEEFHHSFNQANSNIKLTMEFSQQQINFLDTTVYIGNNNKIETSVYRKPTDSQTYLHPMSAHPPHTFKSIVYSQALRYRRICSEATTFRKQSNELKKAFLTLGYHNTIVSKEIKKAEAIPRKKLIEPKLHAAQNRVPLVITFHPALKPLTHIIKQIQPILRNDQCLQKILPKPPIVAYRKPSNLSNIITKSKLQNNQANLGTTPCNKPRCQLCAHINTSPTLIGPNGKKININAKYNCSSSNVIYAISCRLCPKDIYIGETSQTIRKRINGHKSDVKNKQLQKPIGQHFNLANHTIDDLQVQIIAKIRSKSKIDREIAEQKVIQKLDCINLGLNRDSAFLSHYKL